MSVLMTILTSKLYKKKCVKFDAHSEQNDSYIFPPKRSTLKRRRLTFLKGSVNKVTGDRKNTVYCVTLQTYFLLQI